MNRILSRPVPENSAPPGQEPRYRRRGNHHTPALIFSLLLLGLRSLAASQPASSWPEFRGPEGQGISNARNVPVEWSSASNIAWRTSIPGAGWSSPVVTQGRIYLTSAVPKPDDGSGEVSLNVLCFDSASGKQLWDVAVFHPAAQKTKAMHRKNSLASPTPIVRDARIFVHFGHMGTAALGLDGKLIWTQTNLDYQPVHGNGGSPALVDGVLVVSCDGLSDPFVAGLDAKDGSIRWKTPRNTHARKNFSFSTPLGVSIDQKTQVISPGSGFVGGYDPTTGSELWRARYGEGYSVITRPVYARGLLFVSSSYDSPVLYAIRASGAAGDVTGSHIVWSQRRGAPNTPSPLVLNDQLYMVSDGGIASCLNTRDGSIHWSERLSGNFSASPVAAEGRVYFFSEEGVCHVLKDSATFERLAENSLDERTLASPAVIDEAIIVRSESHLWRIGKSEG